jgi:hypothetical protein
MINLRKIPSTSIRDDMLNHSKPGLDRFVEEMNEYCTESDLYDWVGKDKEKAVSCSNFYQMYKQWTVDNGEKSWSNKAVGSRMKAKKMYKTTGKNQRGGIQRVYYTF